MDHLARLKNLLRSYKNQQCVLFVGAGFSLGAQRSEQSGETKGLEDARGLIRIMKDELKEDTDDLGTLSDSYIEEFGEHGLYELLNRLFVATTVTPSQTTIVGYGWKAVYTTNYDNVLQLSRAQIGSRYSTYTTSKRPSDVDYRTLPLIHINGLVEGVAFNDFRNEIKLTNTQYYSDDFSRSAWGERFRNDIITSPCIVFAGYSLYDLDVARILHSFEGMQERIFFVMKDAPSRANERKLLQFGNILTIGVDGLASALSSIQAEPTQESPLLFSAWEQIKLPSETKPPRDVNVINFLVSGNIDETLFASDVIEKNYKVSIDRTASDQIVALVDERKLKNTIITSNIGNGKTTTLDSIAYKLCARGHTVLRAGPHKSLLLKEIPLFRQIEAPIVLIVDDSFGNREVIRAALALNRDDIFILTSARTSQFELQEGDIKGLFSEAIETFNIDALDDREVATLIELLDRYALWGERQSLSNERKSHFIKIECSREIRSVILELLDSPNIRSRIQEILRFDDIPETQDRIRSILIVSQLLNLAEMRPDLSLIGEMIQHDAHKAILQQDRKIRDFSFVQNGRISMRSAIFSEYVLKKIIDTSFVIDVMTRCMNHLDIIHENDGIYREVFRNFSRFRFVETAIATEKRLVHMVKYFENIKELSHCREHPLFWLQYAMCRLSLKQYSEAARLFDVAFAYSERSGYKENRHLNNQYARFLLESRSETNDYNDYMAAFNKAHGICIKQMRDETTYNPYRVAINYQKFLDRRISELTTGDLVGIVRSCGEVTTQIARRQKNRAVSGSKIIDECAKAMKNTIDRARTNLKGLGIDI